jgi:hypothetical protein
VEQKRQVNAQLLTRARQLSRYIIHYSSPEKPG